MHTHKQIFLKAFRSLQKVKGHLEKILLFSSAGPSQTTVLHRGCSVAQLHPSLLRPQAPLFMEFPGQNTEVGYHFFLQGIFLIQGLNSCLLVGRQILDH